MPRVLYGKAPSFCPSQALCGEPFGMRVADRSGERGTWKEFRHLNLAVKLLSQVRFIVVIDRPGARRYNRHFKSRKNCMSATLTVSEESQLSQTIEMFEVITQSQPQDYQSLEILKEAYSKLGREKEVVGTSKRIAQAYVQLGQLSSA